MTIYRSLFGEGKHCEATGLIPKRSSFDSPQGGLVGQMAVAFVKLVSIPNLGINGPDLSGPRAQVPLGHK
jgi:hypothetical protein